MILYIRLIIYYLFICCISLGMCPSWLWMSAQHCAPNWPFFRNRSTVFVVAFDLMKTLKDLRANQYHHYCQYSTNHLLIEVDLLLTFKTTFFNLKNTYFKKFNIFKQVVSHLVCANRFYSKLYKKNILLQIS